MATFNVTVVDNTISARLGDDTIAAATSATRARVDADRAEDARDVSIAAGVQYPTEAAAVAALADGAFGSYLDNLGNPVWAQRDGSVMEPLPGPWIAADKIGFVAPGTGGLSVDVQEKLASLPKQAGDYSSFTNYLANTTDAFFPQNGGEVFRAGRFMAGAAQRSDLTLPGNPNKDWFTLFQIDTDLPGDPDNGTILKAQCASINDGNDSDTAAVAYMGAIQTQHFGSAGTSGIGLMGVVVNNHATLQTQAWAVYAEAHKLNNTVGDTFCFEANTRTLVASITPTPWQQGDVGILHLASGAGVVDQSDQFDASFAIQIVPNTMKFKRGMVFKHDALTDGFAIELAAKGTNPHRIGWTNVAGFQAGTITSIVSGNSGQNLLFTDAGFQVNSSEGFANFRVVAVNSTTNFIQIQAAAGTSTPSIGAASFVNASVDLLLAAQGTGMVQFGTFTSGSDAPINGYMSHKLANGTVVKLATIA